MEIPAVFAGEGDGALVAHTVPDGGCLPLRGSATVPFRDAVSHLPRTEERMPLVVADWDSIRTRTFRETVLKGMKVRGRDVWFMTWIQDADDVMDAFNTCAEWVLAPLHGISGADLDDIVSVSDGVIPVVFAKGGRAVTGGIAPKSIRETLLELDSKGLYRTVVLDTDGSVSEYEWEVLTDLHPSCIPFVSGPERAVCARSRIGPLRPR